MFNKKKEGYIGPVMDVHTHVLPSLDDGAKDMQQSLNMLKIAQREGVTSLFATPHLVCDGSQQQMAARTLTLFEELKKRSADEGLTIKLHLGFEIMLSDALPHMERLTDYVMGSSSYLLVETSFSREPADLDEVLYTLERSGLKMILAHPERSDYLSHNLSLLKELSDRGVLMQVNAGSINGLWGKTVAHIAKKIVSSGLIDLIGSDAHSDNGRGPYVRKALDKIQSICDPEQTSLIACKRAKSIFESDIHEVAI